MATTTPCANRRRELCQHRRLRHGWRPIDLAIFALVFLAALDPGRLAYAYLDPGTGSMVLQLLVGGLAGAMVVAKLYWHQFTGLFRRNRSEAETRPDSPAE